MNTTFKKSLKTLAIALLVTTMLVPGAAFAFGKGHGPGMGRSGHGFERHHKGMESPYGFWKHHRIVTMLGLSHEQVNRLKDADFDYRESCLKIHSQLAELKLQKERAMAETKVKDATVIKIAKDISDLQGKLYVKRVEAQLNVKGILSAEQFQKLESGRREMFTRNRMQRPQGCRFHGKAHPMPTKAE
jgi:Spy/CpxP family protein refolding chaperone